MIKRYRIIKAVVLNFCGPQEQYDLLIDPGRNTFLEANETTVWLIQDGQRHETNNTYGHVEMLLEMEYIQEVEI